MGSPATEEMRQRVLYYLNNIKNGSRDCLNQRFFYELVDCSFEEQWICLLYTSWASPSWDWGCLTPACGSSS